MGEISVVGQEQKPCGVLVQPSYWKKPQFLIFRREKVKNRLLPCILCCGQNAGGLIEHQAARFFASDPASVHGDRRNSRIIFCLRLPDRDAVDLHTSGSDEGARLAP